MTKTTRARYTLEFKQEAVRQVEGGQSQASVAKSLGVAEQPLFNWVKASREGALKGADQTSVSAEQMEISRPRAELARVKMERDVVIDAVRMAWFRRRPGKQSGLIFHSDRGSQYASEDFRNVLKDYGITASMSRRGNCWDNACSETLLGSLKVERLHGQRFISRRHAKDETLAWLLWYNQSRLHSTLNYSSPMQFEERWQTDQTKKVSP